MDQHLLMSPRHHRARRFSGHADPKEWPTMEGRWPVARVGNETLRATRHYGRAFWKDQTGDHATPDRSKDAVPQDLRRTHCRTRSKPLNVHIRFALMTDSPPSAPPRSAGCPGTGREGVRRVSGERSATTLGQDHTSRACGTPCGGGRRRLEAAW
ncbi:hypothetical protein LCGC14_1179480 [marine sediment metagenome]|uniref:Uncharacterized protein n=1 Tax=marine sediment metagenome TaxID=412755 RepID=A0A0F9PT48_9ZZZZ